MISVISKFDIDSLQWHFFFERRNRNGKIIAIAKPLEFQTYTGQTNLQPTLILESAKEIRNISALFRQMCL